MKLKRPLSPTTVYRIAAVLILVLSIYSCANMSRPGGGPRDETPPLFVKSTPAPGALNVSKQRVEIEFDEIIQVESPGEKVIVSPPQKDMPEIRASGRKVTVELKDSLRPDMTYTIDFSDAISDNNEGNPMGNYTYSFSTGERIDTFEVSGNVIDASNLEPIKGILVGLYANLSDTAFTTTPLLRVARTDSRGHFVIKGVAPGTYRAYALQDADGNYMYSQKIEGCSFIVCNTDAQALRKSPVPIKVQLGQGLGAGCDPIKGRNAAIEAQDEITRTVLDTNTQMLFITAGMGGGTGTGAAPVIAEMARKKGILTVAIVTLPFRNEGNESLSKAIDGIHELEKSVDSLLIINNEKLYEYYGDLLVQDAFPKADEILATAVRGIIEIIRKPGYINVDFADVKTMMKNSGMALMGCGSGTGENRIEDAIRQALESPLLNDFDLKTAKNVLINITIGKNEQGLAMKELDEINNKINEFTGNANNFKRGIIFDEGEDVGDRINITVIATGFKMSQLSDITDVNLGNIIMIDNTFTYDGDGLISREQDPDEITTRKIGPTNTANIRKFNYREKPALIVSERQNISELESVTARARAIRMMSESQE